MRRELGVLLRSQHAVPFGQEQGLDVATSSWDEKYGVEPLIFANGR
jgi:hypothetical protein